MSTILLLSALSLASGPIHGAGTTPNLHGKWSYQTSKHWKRGVCPASGPTRGRLSIQRKGSHFTLRLLSGSRCVPASMCHYKGTIRGRVWTAHNRAKVDNEGGVAKNTIVLRAKTRKLARGTVRSSYTHPGGMKCSWGFSITLTRR